MFSRVSRELKDADRRYWRGIWGIFASSSALQTDSSRGGDNFRDADEIAGRRRQDKEPFDQAAPAVTGLAQAADGLDPSERLLDLLTLDRADAIAGMACCAPIDRRASIGIILRDMRRAAAFATARDKVGGIIVLVAAHREAALAGGLVIFERPH